MKGVSVREPFASLFHTGAKTIETRSFRTKHRGELLICASRNSSRRLLEFFLAMPGFQIGLSPLVGIPLDRSRGSVPSKRVEIKHLNFGMAVAVVDLFDCVRVEDIDPEEIKREGLFGNFNRGRFAWKTRLIEAIEPFPVLGQQGFFNVEFERGINV